MNKSLPAILVSILFAVGTPGFSYAAAVASEPQGCHRHIRANADVALENEVRAGIVMGELLKIDEKIYPVKNPPSQEVRFHHDERKRMSPYPVLAIKSESARSSRTTSTQTLCRD